MKKKWIIALLASVTLFGGIGISVTAQNTQVVEAKTKKLKIHYYKKPVTKCLWDFSIGYSFYFKHGKEKRIVNDFAGYEATDNFKIIGYHYYKGKKYYVSKNHCFYPASAFNTTRPVVYTATSNDPIPVYESYKNNKKIRPYTGSTDGEGDQEYLMPHYTFLKRNGLRTVTVNGEKYYPIVSGMILFKDANSNHFYIGHFYFDKKTEYTDYYDYPIKSKKKLNNLKRDCYDKTSTWEGELIKASDLKKMATKGGVFDVYTMTLKN
ncbi:hypothetical protein GCM10022297_06300 [Lactobacillus hamsteri]|uniref:Surface layer protein A domain-containing protein n=1 Tax=Lactobacillus hamsteri DSM 5661 = JCM 6256 TaxID=1423754 RepID=A0A0R1YE95_9LACO|nr:hypothetical protein [Lactobacillus hamsteri]KRM40674.1 hypothetical protein FC39_GL000226 [Lactobacillus hamsteri DSM 5661 = JCM 6256]